MSHCDLDGGKEHCETQDYKKQVGSGASAAHWSFGACRPPAVSEKAKTKHRRVFFQQIPEQDVTTGESWGTASLTAGGLWGWPPCQCPAVSTSGGVCAVGVNRADVGGKSFDCRALS